MTDILVTGGTGMIGKALKTILPDATFVGSEWDLRDLRNAKAIFANTNPKRVIHLAAKVGGVKANSEMMADFYTDNLLINTNLLRAAHHYKVDKVVSMMSTCVYPDKVKYPLTEDQLHNGPPHETNFGYAYAKRMLDVQSKAYRKQYGCNFITAIPNNLYGMYDNFDLENSHVIPAMIRKFHEATLKNKTVELWGTGAPLREFTYALDAAKILLFLLETYDEAEPVNIGNTDEYSIRDVAAMIAASVGYNKKLKWNVEKPNGQLKKPSSNEKLIKLGWDVKDYTSLKNGLETTIAWFMRTYPNIRGVKVR